MAGAACAAHVCTSSVKHPTTGHYLLCAALATHASGSISETLTIQVGKEGLQSTYVVYPAKKPKAVDLKSRRGETKGRIYLGIYGLEGDSLKICFSEHEQHRPTEFVGRGTPGIRTLFVHERVLA